MHRFRFAMLAALAVPASAVAAPPPAEPAGKETKPAAAETQPAVTELANVNGTAITTADVERTLRTRYGPQIDSMPPEQRAMAIGQATPQVAEELIARTLLLNAAKEAKTVADAAEIQKTIDSIKGSLPPDTTFETYLGSVGHDEASIRAEIGEEIAISQHMRSKLDALPKATDETIANYYEEHKAEFVTQESVAARHILLKTDPGAGDDAKKAALSEIEKLRQQLIDAKGEGFEALAKEHSDCPSGAQGGSLGDFGRGQMVPEFDKAAFEQTPGEIGEVIETQFGYHIIKVDKKTTAGQQPFDAVKESIAERMNGESQQSAVQDYLGALEKAAKITRSAALTPPAPPTPGAPE